MTEEKINDLADEFDDGACDGWKFSEEALHAFARALLAAGASEGQAVGEIREIDGFTQVVLKAKAKLPDRTKLYTHPSAEIAALRDRIAGMEKDAQRYRHIRATTRAIRDDNGENRTEVTPEQFDEAIDAAIAKEKK